MIPGPPSRRRHSRAAILILKAALLVAALPGFAYAQSAPAGDDALRAELARLLRENGPADALRHAQAALRAQPDNAGVQHEYVALHLALARQWLAAEQFAACRTAVEAVLALDPDSAPALELRRQLDGAEGAVDDFIREVDQLLKYELFDAALERVRAIKALRPDLAELLRAREKAAWLGTADDHYLARNFAEAFALYEQTLKLMPDAPADVHSRWAISLGVALSEADFDQPMDANTAARLLARAIDVLHRTTEPIAGQIIGGLLAERAGRLVEAGQEYAAALGRTWELPPADRRREVIAGLRNEAVEKLRALYGATPTRRRDGMWSVALPDVWKCRRTPHFDVYAHSDVVAARVAEVLSYHLPRLAEWLGVDSGKAWEPRLEVRVHAAQSDLHEATGTSGITYAVSNTRVQGRRVLSRKLEVFQADPWLLSSTLPHELTHAILVGARGAAAPRLVIDEGLALQAEPAARRLMYRRRLPTEVVSPDELLGMNAVPGDLEQFYARAGAVVGWLLDRLGAQPATATQPSLFADLLGRFGADMSPRWWSDLGWKSEEEMLADWREWCNARRDPPRMPLMILVEPTLQPNKAAGGGH